MEGITGLGDLSTTALVLLGAAAATQLALQVLALVDLWKRPVVMFGNKWIWVAVLLLGGLIGLVVYAAVGRLPGSVLDETADQATTRRAPSADDKGPSAADVLYGTERRS